LQLATDFLKDAYAVELRGYRGDNLHYILALLKPPQFDAVRSPDLWSTPEILSDDVIFPSSGPYIYGGASRRRRRRRRSKRRFATSAIGRPQDGGYGGEPEAEVDIVVLDSQPDEFDVTYRTVSAWNDTSESKYAERYTYVTRLLQIAHGLHYIGIGILAVFVVQVFTVSCFYRVRKKVSPPPPP